MAANPNPITIGLISDTHGLLAPDVIKHIKDCDQIWHAGDIGSIKIAEEIEAVGPPAHMVWGNIDGTPLRKTYPLNWMEEVNGLKVFMTHIGGYPPRYYKRVREIIKNEKPDLYICGHSHILKVMPDKEHKLLHMNPGACGIKGFHKFRTIIKFDIVDGVIDNARVVELGLRGDISNLK